MNSLLKKKVLKIDFKKLTYIFLLSSISVFSQLAEKKQSYIVNHICLNGSLQVSAMGEHFELEHHKVKWVK